MNISVDDLYIEIGKMTAILRKREEQVAEREARIAQLEAELAVFTVDKKGSEKSPTT